MLGCCGGVYVDFSGGLWLLCWIVVVVVDVGPCTCMNQALLLSWRAQATLHQLSCDLGRGVHTMEGMWWEIHFPVV